MDPHPVVMSAFTPASPPADLSDPSGERVCTDIAVDPHDPANQDAARTGLPATTSAPSATDAGQRRTLSCRQA
jgi:hypothetical protein